MFAARLDPAIKLPAATLTSGLELIPHAAELVTGPIGVLTIAKADVERLLADHPLRSRLKIVELQHLPGWNVFVETTVVSEEPIDMEPVRESFTSYVGEQLASGELEGVEALVLECTVLPQLRPQLRELTSVPIFDVLSYACSLSR